jgi:hypothetical protein
MLKKYYVGLVLVLLTALYVSSQYQNHAERTTQQGAQFSDGSFGKAHDNHSQENAKDAKWYPPRWYRLVTWPEGITTWALMLTLLAIAEQTKETAKAAKAAMKSANALVDSERALLDVEIRISSYDPPTKSLIAINIGKTPAFLVHYVIGASERPRDSTEDSLPDGFRGDTHRLGGITGEPYRIIRADGKDTEIISERFTLYTTGTEPHCVFWHGHAEYEDMFRRKYRTEVTYRYRNGAISENLKKTRYIDLQDRAK